MSSQTTDIEAYTPGRCASATLFGIGFNHRSGFHSSASSPHIFLQVFTFMIETWTVVPFLIGISLISDFPSADLMGQRRGIITSLRVLSKLNECRSAYREEVLGIVRTSAELESMEGSSEESHDRQHRGTVGSWACHNQDHHTLSGQQSLLRGDVPVHRDIRQVGAGLGW